MTTVVLLGYSCAGKSTIVRELELRHPGLCTIDSDRRIALPNGEHIYNVYCQLGRDAAIVEISKRECALLDSLQPTEAPRLIAAGPALPSRVRWDTFITRVNPVCLYIRQTPEQVLSGLRDRHDRQAEDPSIAEHSFFGSWDENVTTQRTSAGTWEPVDDTTALANIRREMAPSAFIYQRYADSTHTYPARDLRLPNVVERCLGLLPPH